jgi:hypothetical protein
MLQNRPGRRKRPWLHRLGRWIRPAALALTLLVALPALYGRGKQDNDVLSQADELIAQKRYSDAISILTDYARENPEDFDHAQERIQKILQFKDEYNYTAQLLLDEMEKEEPDNDRILVLTNTLFELDPLRIAETQDFIARTRDVAQFKANQRRLERILNEGQALIARGQYAEALRTYAGGLTIYQAEFFNSGYGAAMENRARQGISNLNGNLALFASVSSSLLDSVKDLENMANQGIELQNLINYRNTYDRIGAEMDRLTALREVYDGTDTSFKEDLTRLRQTSPQTRDRNFLAFAIVLLEGRGDDPNDGMLGALDSLWNSTAPKVRDLLDAKSRSVYVAAINESKAQEYGRIGTRAELMAEYAALPENLEIRWNRYDTSAQKVTIFDQTVPSGEAENYLRFRALSESSAYLRTLGTLGSRFTAIQQRDTVEAWRNGGNAEDLVRQEQSNTNAFRQIREEAQTLAATIQREIAEYRSLETSYPNSGASEYINGISSIASSLVNAVAHQENNSAMRRYTIANGTMETRVAQREQEFGESSTLLQGTQGEGNFISKYPTLAAELLTRMDASIEADAQGLQNLLDQYNAEPAELLNSPEVSSLRDTALAMQGRLTGTRTQGRSMIANARAQAEQAAALRRDGSRYLAEAQSLLTQSSFENARDTLLQAQTAYDRSLELEDDEATRNQRNNALSNLGEEIASRLNQWVLVEVQSLLTQVAEAYFGGDFENAERLVTRAQNTWKLSQPDDNPEILNWQGMIRVGLRSGRKIPVTAPLYAEMSQLLSEAQKNYEEGRDLMASSPAEGREKLNLAKQNIIKVKLVYPMNETAGLLELRIEQQEDPPAFAANFDARVRNAIAGCGRGDLESYNMLLNLQTINPDYPNWRSIITQAEYGVGLRQRPPDPAVIARSNERTEFAQAIITSGDSSRRDEALAALTEAIRLNPENQTATVLYRQFVATRPTGPVVLDSESERMYQQAIAALTQNNALGALTLVTAIYARDARYRNVNRLIELERRARRSL